MRTIGINTIGYNQEKNITKLPFRNYFVKKVQNLFKIPAFLLLKTIPHYDSQIFWNSFYDFEINSVDFFHFFNALSFGKKPWITTFETVLPRWGKSNDYRLRRGLKLQASKPCKYLIGFSENAMLHQKYFIKERFPEFYDEIVPKLRFIHPSQQRYVDDYDEKNLAFDKDLIFTFVGNDFFRKGGMEILRVFSKFIQQGYPLKLNLVSNLSLDDFASGDSNEEKSEALKLIENYKSNVHIFPRLSNDEVIKLFIKSHVGLLPTYADSYGYSAIEAQSCGCPVISTNVRSLPEINNNNVGWEIAIPKDRWGNAGIYTKKDRKVLSDCIAERLEEIISSIMKNPYQIKEKGIQSLNKVSETNDPVKNALYLEGLYDTI